MKKMATITLLLIVMLGWGQEAKLDYWWQYSYGWNDTAHYVIYSYDSIDNLTQVYYTQQVEWPRTVTYSNDTLIKDKLWGHWNYSYYYIDDDTILVKNYGDSVNYLILSENNEVIYDGDLGSTWNWQDGNCMEEINQYGDTSWYREYYTEYINPWYEENKYLRRGRKTGTGSGSYNLWSSHTTHNGFEWEMIVIESIGLYPTVIELFSDGELNSTYYFEYKDINTGISEIPNNYRVISVDYFDMLGRKIPKPNKGFYIERKVTDKGIISTKHYIR